jgi:hypothetical protein
MSNSAHRGTPRRRPAIIALITLGALVAGGTAAYAYWTTQGTGTGTATTGSVENLTVTQTSQPTDIYPGGPARELEGTIDNPNDSSVEVAGLTAAVTSTGVTGCDVEDYSIVGTATLAGTVVPGDGTLGWDGLGVELENTAENQDACQNAIITITYTVVPAA